tara:strand:+ start:10978 stop:11307 length:330 start_codon:yes stop_codon:yes gene_type:complete
MNKPTTIKQVLAAFDIIIENAIVTNNRLGLFAYLYRRTTAEILKEVELGHFENNEQLQHMGVAFATLYLEAHTDYHVGNKRPISLDLSIATSATMNGKLLGLLRKILIK